MARHRNRPSPPFPAYLPDTSAWAGRSCDPTSRCRNTTPSQVRWHRSNVPISPANSALHVGLKRAGLSVRRAIPESNTSSAMATSSYWTFCLRAAIGANPLRSSGPPRTPHRRTWPRTVTSELALRICAPHPAARVVFSLAQSRWLDDVASAGVRQAPGAQMMFQGAAAPRRRQPRGA